MKRLLPVGFVILLSCVTTVAQTGSQDREHIDIVRDQFIGAWRLAWLEEPGADGKVYRADCTGLLVYTREGYMSVQVMYNKPQTKRPAGGGNMRKLATKPPLADMKSTAPTPSPFTLTARGCGRLSAKT